ncbi:1649_t:CDS:2 [Acaulospora colombiana]|uniref:1649_t:CDS:1 n=1 Tax=Acaulospora colombiana TaxID=27376 RepID=A0ACA9KHN8_9GLOM|nr:1649_t:CDS:2 [Acaulospora colombiana]
MTINLLETLSKDYKTLLETGDFADIVVQVGDEPHAKAWFKAHSLVLKARSSYFRTKLATGSSNVVSFNEPNITPKLFSVLLMYIYFGTIELSQYNVPEIIYLLCGARELCLTELCDYIQDYFINRKELVKKHFFFVARASYNHFEKLSSFCNNILKEDPEAFINSQDFFTIRKNELLSFYKNHPNNIREIVLWEKLVEWGVSQFPSLTTNIATWTNDDFESLRELMDPFIQCIDFQRVSRSEFLQKVRPFKKLFDDGFYIEILEYHTFPELSDSLGVAASSSSSSTGSNHGFSSKAFHDRCDLKGPTLTLINVSKTDEIIGGFNPLNWVLDRSKGVYQRTRNSFIFSLNKMDLDKSIYSRVVDETHAIYSHIDFGPSFGARKYDLKLYGKFDDGNGNCCNKKSYSKGIRSSGESFKVKEYEVYQVIKAS